MPDLPGSEMSIDMRRDTPADAPPVRKMCSGYAGCPSRATREKARSRSTASQNNAANRREEEHRPCINSATCLRISGTP